MTEHLRCRAQAAHACRVGALLLAAAGCTAAETPLNPSGPSPEGGVADSSLPDAGSPSSEATAPEAAIPDTPTPDTSDESSPQDGYDGVNPTLCNSNFLFCDGFEHAFTGWAQVYASGGSPSVDALHVYRGLSALHANVNAIAEAGTTAYAYVQQYQSLPWPTHFFTRFFAYVPSPAAPSTEGLVDLDENGGAYSGIELRLSPTCALTMETFSTGNDQQWASTTTAPLDTWVCFELEVDVGAQTVHVYMNDAEVADLMRTNLALPQLGITGVGLGFFQASVQAAQDAWIDEVAVDAVRIGCAR